jgi:hypothetical protein
MFGLFGKKKVTPKNALEELIHTIYGNPPPAKSADLKRAVDIAFDEFLMGTVTKSEILKVAQDLNAGPMPYSTNDLAASIALNFFKQDALKESMKEIQLVARMKMLELINEGSINPFLAQSFEDTLYKLYKP